MAWRRFFAVGCSHGNWADPVALTTALRFKRNWQPHTTIHLGDYLDLTSFRSGASAVDVKADLQSDITAGINFLRELEPDHIFDGNHDDRVFRLIDHPDARLSYCASHINYQIDELASKLHAKRVPYDIDRGWRQPLGPDINVGHGYMFNECALRDHAEAFGSCIIAHLHTPGMANGRRLNNPIAYCAGYLGDRDKFTYAKTNKSKLKWNQGFIWGEYNSKCTIVRIEQRASDGTWRLPL